MSTKCSRARQTFATIVVTLALGLGVRPAQAQTECGGRTSKPISAFGDLGLWAMQFPLMQSVGLDSHQITGKNVTWSYLMPDGVNFNAVNIKNLDIEVRTAFEQGMTNVVLRVLTGGGGQDPFTGAQSSWPVDMATYDTKDGEWLGPQPGSLVNTLTAYPPKVLTTDTPGTESAFYNFVHALALRYNGCTLDPDPLYAGKYLPRVDYWTGIHEPDSKGFWYGTSKDIFGGVGGNPAVGMLPSMWRAIKSANPAAKIVSGGLSSQNIGYYLTFEKAQQAGNLYNTTVRNYGKSYFWTSYPLQQPFNTYQGNDAGLYQHYATDSEEVRSRTILDAGFSAAASAWYDIVGIHFYDNPAMTDDVVSWVTRRQTASKPVWFTEAGFVDQPQFGQAALLDTPTQAQALIQKFVTLVADGVQHVVYSPVMASPTAPSFEPLFDGAPSTPAWRPAAYSMQLVAHAIDELTGYTFFMKRTAGGGLFYEFAHSDGTHHLAFAWHPSATANVDLRALFGISATQPIDIYDYQGTMLWQQSTQTTYTVTASPVLIEWTGQPTTGCGNVRDSGSIPVANFTILAFPALSAWAMRRQRRPAPARARAR